MLVLRKITFDRGRKLTDHDDQNSKRGSSSEKRELQRSWITKDPRSTSTHQMSTFISPLSFFLLHLVIKYEASWIDYLPKVFIYQILVNSL